MRAGGYCILNNVAVISLFLFRQYCRFAEGIDESSVKENLLLKGCHTNIPSFKSYLCGSISGWLEICNRCKYG